MKTFCTACGKDCSHAYGTWYGKPYHFGCIPAKRKPVKTPTLTAAEFKSKIYELGFNQVNFAATFGFSARAVRDWIADKNPVPPYVASIVALLEKSKLNPEDLWQ